MNNFENNNAPIIGQVLKNTKSASAIKVRSKKEIISYTFSSFDLNAGESIGQSLTIYNKERKNPIFACIGSDLVLGDSLGPLVGTMLVKKNIPFYVYGTLKSPITAKDVLCVKKQLKLLHPNSYIISIDAGVGEVDDSGLIKTVNCGLKPGLGVNRNLGVIGDCSIIGIVAEKSAKNYQLFNMTRLNLIYTMAEKIVSGIESFTAQYKKINYYI